MVLSDSSVVREEPIWKLDRLGSAGQLFWRRDSGGLLNRSGKARVKFNYEVEVLEYLPHDGEHREQDEDSALKRISSALHVVVVALVCVAATVTTFSWLVQ